MPKDSYGCCNQVTSEVGEYCPPPPTTTDDCYYYFYGYADVYYDCGETKTNYSSGKANDYY